MKQNPLIELFWKVHPFLYRVSGGKILGRLAGMEVLLLSTVGARTGTERTTALTYLRPRANLRSFVVVASFLGAPRHPAWVHNLRANPTAKLQVGRERFPVTAREAHGEERTALWAEIGAAIPAYKQYESATSRRIPLVLFERTSPGNAALH